MGTMIDCGPEARELLTRLTTPTRNRFYYGKLLDAFHLELEQDYGNRKRWLLNRLSLGTGVLCGLKVERSKDRTLVRVGPGVAIDGWGREIVVEQDSPAVDPKQPTDDCGGMVGTPLRGGGRMTLWICYHECETEPSLVRASECERACENGLIRERYRLRITAGATTPPGVVTPEQCKTIFSSVPDKEGRRALISEVLAGLCVEPKEGCVPLALLELDQDGLVARIDPIRPRPMLYSNAVLLDLILCLAARVDACCPAQAVKILRILSGDNQTGNVGSPLPAALSVRVTQGGAVVPTEPVTFRVASGLGAIGNPPNPLGPTLSTQTDGNGIATLPQWKLGTIVGQQQVTAEIENGAQVVPFNATAIAVKVDLPVINTVWPPYGSSLSPVNSDTRLAYGLFLKLKSIELDFSHLMNKNHLDAPADWLRFFMISASDREHSVLRVELRHATAAEAAVCAGAIPSLLLGGNREFFLLNTDQAQAILNGGRHPTGTPLRLDGTAVPRIIKCLILVKSDPNARAIEDRMAPPNLLDADFQGTTLETLPGAGAAPRSLWDDIWDVPLGAVPVFGNDLWNALQVTADSLPSGDTIEGGRLASWFTIEF
jgi:hypothetical protein